MYPLVGYANNGGGAARVCWGVHGKSLYFPLSVAVTQKLL